MQLVYQPSQGAAAKVLPTVTLAGSSPLRIQTPARLTSPSVQPRPRIQPQIVGPRQVSATTQQMLSSLDVTNPKDMALVKLLQGQVQRQQQPAHLTVTVPSQPVIRSQSILPQSSSLQPRAPVGQQQQRLTSLPLSVPQQRMLIQTAATQGLSRRPVVPAKTAAEQAPVKTPSPALQPTPQPQQQQPQQTDLISPMKRPPAATPAASPSPAVPSPAVGNPGFTVVPHTDSAQSPSPGAASSPGGWVTGREYVIMYATGKKFIGEWDGKYFKVKSSVGPAAISRELNMVDLVFSHVGYISYIHYCPLQGLLPHLQLLQVLVQGIRQ